MTLSANDPASRLSALAAALQKARNAPTEAEALAAVGVAPDGCTPLNPENDFPRFRPEDVSRPRTEPTIASIIESHRAVCTASAEQITDLESQLYHLMEARIAAAVEPVIKDARQQLENVKATADIFTMNAWRGDAVAQAEAQWRRQNPGLSAVVSTDDD